MKTSKRFKVIVGCLTAPILFLAILFIIGISVQKSKLKQANNLWDSSKKEEAVEIYKSLAKNTLEDYPIAIERIIVNSIERKQPATASEWIEKSKSWGINLSISNTPEYIALNKNITENKNAQELQDSTQKEFVEIVINSATRQLPVDHAARITLQNIYDHAMIEKSIDKMKVSMFLDVSDIKDKYGNDPTKKFLPMGTFYVDNLREVRKYKSSYIFSQDSDWEAFMLSKFYNLQHKEYLQWQGVK